MKLYLIFFIFCLGATASADCTMTIKDSPTYTNGMILVNPFRVAFETSGLSFSDAFHERYPLVKMFLFNGSNQIGEKDFHIPGAVAPNTFKAVSTYFINQAKLQGKMLFISRYDEGPGPNPVGIAGENISDMCQNEYAQNKTNTLPTKNDFIKENGNLTLINPFDVAIEIIEKNRRHRLIFYKDAKPIGSQEINVSLDLGDFFWSLNAAKIEGKLAFIDHSESGYNTGIAGENINEVTTTWQN